MEKIIKEGKELENILEDILSENSLEKKDLYLQQNDKI